MKDLIIDNSTLIFLETMSALFKLQPVEKPNAIQLQGLVDKVSAMFNVVRDMRLDFLRC